MNIIIILSQYLVPYDLNAEEEDKLFHENQNYVENKFLLLY